MKKRFLFMLVICSVMLGINQKRLEAAVQLDPNGSGNIITHFGGIPSSMANKAYTQYRFKNGNGYTDVMMVTAFYRKTSHSPVTIKNIQVSYNTSGSSTPYIPNFFIDKRDGSKAFDVLSKISKTDRMLNKKAGVYNIPLNVTNAQSVNLYIQNDINYAAGKRGSRLQYIATFY